MRGGLPARQQSNKSVVVEGGGGLNTSAASRPASARGKGTSVRCSGTASASSASDQEGERVAGPGDLGGRGGCVVEEGPTRRRGQPSAGQGPGRARPVGTRWSARRATRQTNETGGQARPGGPETAPPLLRSHFAEPRPQTGLARPGSVPSPHDVVVTLPQPLPKGDTTGERASWSGAKTRDALQAAGAGLPARKAATARGRA